MADSVEVEFELEELAVDPELFAELATGADSAAAGSGFASEKLGGFMGAELLVMDGRGAGAGVPVGAAGAQPAAMSSNHELITANGNRADSLNHENMRCPLVTKTSSTSSRPIAVRSH